LDVEAVQGDRADMEQTGKRLEVVELGGKSFESGEWSVGAIEHLEIVERGVSAHANHGSRFALYEMNLDECRERSLRNLYR